MNHLTTETGRQRGVIKLYIKDGAYGFIIPDDGSKDVFFHISKFKTGTKLEDIDKGVIVSYFLVEKNKGLQATSIKIEGVQEGFEKEEIQTEQE